MRLDKLEKMRIRLIAESENFSEQLKARAMTDEKSELLLEEKRWRRWLREPDFTEVAERLKARRHEREISRP